MAINLQEPPPIERTADKYIVLSVQQLFAYTVFIITVGASIYTFVKAIPKIDRLDETINQLQVSNGHMEEKISNLTKQLEEAKK